MFELITEADRQEAWQESGARDLAHFRSMRFGISYWKASRWIHAAHAPQRLPRLSEAFGSGLLGIDKVVELARFATAETESDLVSWAGGVSVGCVRRKADVIVRQAIEDVRDAQASRFLSWWYFDDGRRFGLEAELPAAEGAAVARALENLADDLPVMPGEEDLCHADARRADALVALASTSLAADPDPDRASVVVHAPLEALVSGETGCELEGGGLIHAETARRLLCSGRVQAVIENGRGHPVGVGRMAREPSAWMLRQLWYRDSECRFPGCGGASVHAGPPHRLVGAGRPHRPGQPAPPVHVPPQAGSRARVGRVARKTERSDGSIPTGPATGVRLHPRRPSNHDHLCQPCGEGPGRGRLDLLGSLKSEGGLGCPPGCP
jgi:Domain of unknown function (DUF222)